MYCSTDRYEAEKLDMCLEILRTYIVEDTPAELKAHFYAIEYMVAVHRIFITRFVNSEAVLLLECKGKRVKSQGKGKRKIFLEYATEKECFQKYLQYFATWRHEFQAAKAYGNPNWDHYFLSAMMWNNL